MMHPQIMVELGLARMQEEQRKAAQRRLVREIRGARRRRSRHPDD